ncbi:MAG: helix-hairpin-helix domain-containing protein, partial [Deltaproteobacteria bacterium]|nr:helix-hairpin-helix domain-containing protein [Deltaproteobacteria bacterium]
PGIGPRTAERIGEYRKVNGPFRTAEDLLNIKGIGPKVLQKLKPFITVS